MTEVVHEAGARKGIHPELIICEHCDSVHERPRLGAHQRARCLRCGAEIARGHRLSLDSQLALTVTALVLFILANAFPVIELQVGGRHHRATLFEAGLQLVKDHTPSVAILALATAFGFPLAEILLRLWCLCTLRFRWLPDSSMIMLRWLNFLQTWSMVEVYLIGMLVTIFKMGAMARVIPEVGIFSVAALTVVIGALRSCGTRAIWDASGIGPAGDLRRGQAGWLRP